MKNEIIKFENPELQVIEQSKADKIKATFHPMAEMLAGFEKQYNDLIQDSINEITPEISARAKRLRLDIGRVRIDTGKLKDKQKEYIKLEDKAIMGVHNILVWAVKEKEDKLKEIEKHAEIQEKKRLEALQLDRAERLSLYVEDAHERDLVKFEDDEFEALLEIKRKEQADRLAAEKKAEDERKEKERKEKLYFERRNKLSQYQSFSANILDFNLCEFGDLSDSEFTEIEKKLIAAKDEHDKKTGGAAKRE